MKKITLNLFTMIALLVGATSFAQGTGVTSNTVGPAGYQNNYGAQNINRNAVSDVLILGAPSTSDWINDVEEKIESIGEHDVVTFLISQGTPTITELQGFDAVFLFTDTNAQDPVAVGNVLAQYLEEGGAVVDATFIPSIGIEGDWTPYELYSNSGQSTASNLMLGTSNDNDNFLLDVVTLDGGTASFHNTGGTVATGATIVLEWETGVPLLITQENVGPMNVRRAFLNIFPVSEDARNDFWDTDSDFGQLMSNVLEWAITSQVLSIEENEINTNFSVFPNPAQNKITISSEGNLELRNAQIVDVTGRIVNTFNLEGIETTVSTADLNTGIYFLRVEESFSSQSIKFIKN